LRPHAETTHRDNRFDDACDLFVACTLLTVVIVPVGWALSAIHVEQGAVVLACGFVVFVCGTLCNSLAAAIGLCCWTRRPDLRTLTLWLTALAASGTFLALSLAWWVLDHFR
jgi:hypothetical protein